LESSQSRAGLNPVTGAASVVCMSKALRPRRSVRAGRVALLLSAALVAGCAGPQLMPTPNMYRDRSQNPFAGVPAVFRTNRVDLLYVTDRRREPDARGRPAYTYGRSPTLAYGSCVVELGRGLDWDRLVALSRATRRTNAVPVRVAWVRELGRLPDEPPVRATAAGLEYDPAAEAARQRAVAQFQTEVQRRLELTPRKEVFLYVHGFNNDFNWAATVAAQLWHFLPRQGVPVLYTWPAGRGGLLGYNYDRESSEFTVGHLKQTLRALLTCPGVEKIHLLAHSRGTDVASSAVRELLIEQRGPERPVLRLARLENLILIAPDLDFDVAGQRLGDELVPLAVGRLTVYVHEKDRAVNLANWFFEGFRRLGQLRTTDFTEEQKRRMREARSVQFIDARVRSDLLGHGYFHNHPAVSSDLLQLLRENCDAGDEACRPLRREDGVFWKITDDYLAPPP
jgi:esterase/lipase superfamily enzyme